MPLAIFLLLFLLRSLSLLLLSSTFPLSSPRSSQGSAGCPSEQRSMRSATRLSVSWDRSPCAPSPWPCRRCPPRGRLRRPAPRRRRRLRACAPPSSRRRPRARSRGRRPRAASRRAWPRRCVLSTPSPLHGRGDRPVHAHGRGPGLPRAHDGRPADRRARAVPGARLRRARRDLSLGPRQPARTRGRRWPTGRTA